MKFKDKYGLPFTLLADPEHAVAEQYGVWVEKTYYGKTYMGVERSTFVIDADGTSPRSSATSKPETHADAGARAPLAALSTASLTSRMSLRADVAELVDAHGSGPCALRAWRFKSSHPHSDRRRTLPHSRRASGRT